MDLTVFKYNFIYKREEADLVNRPSFAALALDSEFLES